MKYDWEKKLKVAQACFAADCELSRDKGLMVVGLAVVNAETGEGALVNVGDIEEQGSVINADYWKDILGDASEKYQETVVAMREDWKARRVLQ